MSDKDILKRFIPITDYEKMVSEDEVPEENPKAKKEVAKISHSATTKQIKNANENSNIKSKKVSAKIPANSLVETSDGQLAFLDENHVLKPIDKISNTIVNQDLVGKGEQSVDQFVDKDSGEKITTIIDLSYKGEEVDTNLENLNVTIYMREILDAVTSLYLQGKTFVTPAIIYRQMVGAPKHCNLNSDSKEQIERAMDRMRYLNLKINSKSEKKFYDALSASYESYLINASKTTITINHVEISGYRLYSVPILSEYALAKKQVIYLKNDVIKIPNVRNTPLFISTRAYLLRRVEQIRSILKRQGQITQQQKTILFSTIYDAIGTEGNRQKNKRIREHVHVILDYWKEIHYIKTYKIAKKRGRIYHAIIVDVQKNYQLISPEDPDKKKKSSK